MNAADGGAGGGDRGVAVRARPVEVDRVGARRRLSARPVAARIEVSGFGQPRPDEAVVGRAHSRVRRAQARRRCRDRVRAGSRVHHVKGAAEAPDGIVTLASVCEQYGSE